MATVEHATVQEWLQREMDGDLAASDRERMAGHLAQCPECRTEQRQLQQLHEMLHGGSVEVREGFHNEVMMALPNAPWQVHARRAWRLPLAALVLLVAASAILFQMSSGSLGSGAGGSVLGLASAVVELFSVALLAGGGILGSSWQGLRLVVQELVSGSATGMIGLAALVLGLNGLLFVALRRGPKGATTTVRGDDR